MYANDSECLISSMNLHNYSLNNNIETGILTEFKTSDIASNFLSMVAPKIFSDPLDTQAMDFVRYIIEKSTIEFERKSKKETSMFGLFSSYITGEIIINKSRTGFCIKSKEVIAFNPLRPYTKYSFDIWTKYGSNKTFQENYCHQWGKDNKSGMA